MKLHPRNLILLSTVIVAASISATALINARATRRSTTELATLARKRDSIEKEVERLNARLAAAEKDRKASELELDELAKPTRSTSVTGASNTPAPNSTAEFERDLSTTIVAEESRQKEPKAQNEFLEMLRSRLAVTYAPFFRTSGVTGEQIAEFEAIAAKRDETQFDLGALLRAGKLSLQDPSAGKLFSQVDLDFTASVKAVLGEVGFQQLQDFERTLPTREIVRSMAGEAAVSGYPLTTEQAERMTRILADATPDYRGAGKRFPPPLNGTASIPKHGRFSPRRSGTGLRPITRDDIRVSSML